MPGDPTDGQQPAEAGAGQQPADGNAKGQQAAPNQPVQTQLQEPEIAAEGAVLIDGATGKILYGKNADQQFYPASITKIMTALLVLERCALNDMVTFSAGATTNLESGAVSLDITEGDRLTVEQSLHGLLMKSANEIGNGLAEHVAGSVSDFAELMNARARELGCTNTHFVNPHGLNHSSHKTTPHDMALIMRAALQNKDFRRIDTTLTYDFPATQKASARTITMGHKMMYPSDSRYYEGIIGGKTGYTSLAGNTLVTGAERNGVQLIAVIMKSKQTHYTDTKALLDYGFSNYQTLMGSQR
jgi:D-alanyl-D-alanine carboxypeptidase